ncbi:MAG TPA: CheR family methyltransferase [Bryobacteraceae bacterium]|jgi:two-component system CheB/CheR fusion protein|nr:CheR family methyltransferase [Bryobacteraceae bacterium]
MSDDIQERGAQQPDGGESTEPAVVEARPEQAEMAPIEVVDEQAVVVEDGEQNSPLPFPVAAIGASAGGVEAYVQLFNSLAADTGMAFVVISHLLADHKSHLVEILGRQTTMPVEHIRNGVRPEPNRIYVLPPNAQARMERGSFRLETRPSPGGVPRPIDYFFRSLAAEQKTRAVGVVLSGTDADGTLGLKAIKGEGGITIVQSPESARFSEMPRSGLSIDHVDRVLPPGQIATELAQLGRQFREPSLRLVEEGAPQPGVETHFSRILNLLRGVSGVDFRLYKPTTIRRRIARRMLLHRIQTLGEYVSFLQGNGKELRELQEDSLINVTRFFRDPQVFDALKQMVFPRIFDGREPDQQVRIWVAGCSSGEEAYSIAICLLEYLAGQPFEPPIQIFGTDASDLNIQRARVGIYPESIAGEVSPDRLRRFFVKVDKGYQVSKRLRDLCIFARQNLCHDPPFSKMDLISCRNVLIYFGAELQKQLLPTFHYALRPNGFLLLGTSETIREFTDLFQLLDRRHKFFAKIGNGTTRSPMAAFPRLFVPEAAAPPPAQEVAGWGDLELQRAADRIVLARYGPPGVVVNERMEILQSRGHTAPYVEMPQGAVTLNLGRMLRDSIATQVSGAVRHAIEQDVPVHIERLRVSENGASHDISVEVLPIHTTAPRSRCFLVLFVPQQEQGVLLRDERETSGSVEGQEHEQLVERLRQDLASTKLYLQTLLEERDAKNQELVSANEEIQSANEEMQSTNEELETTKEELQSSNEKLQTVNDELQQRNAVLTQTTNDLSNLLNSVNLPVLMLGNDLHIRHFTPPTQRLMNLRAPDVGGPFSEIRLNLNIPDLEPVFNEVLETLTPREMEVQDREGHWYLLRVRPYRTTENRIEGLVVVLLDIDQLRRSQQELRGARDFAASVIQNVPLPLAVVDTNLRIHAVNDALRALAGAGKDDLEKRSIVELARSVWGMDEPLRGYLEQLRKTSEPRSSFEFSYRLNEGTVRTLTVRGCVLNPDGDRFLLITLEDVTAHKEVERLLAAERERLQKEVATTASELVRTRNELRALAGSLFTSQEDERRRVARELHDDICQKLAVLEIDMQQVEARIANEAERAAEDLQRVRQTIGSLANDVRQISHALHPSIIDDLGAAAALRSLVDDFREREHMIVTYSVQRLPENIPTQVATGLYRIAQEALRNVAKHAGKTHVKVTLRGDGSRVRLQVFDSGEGFDPAAQRSGLGLICMEERARMMEGTFAVESKPGEGTRVTVEVPLPAAAVT